MSALRKTRVRTPGGEYVVTVGSGALEKLPAAFKGRGFSGAAKPSSLHLVSDRSVHRRHGKRVEALLRETGLPISKTILPPGESTKSLDHLGEILRSAIRAGCDRRACLVALGGGVITDITGYAAASLLRGVPFVGVPTSLLAMVDASVGGKTGINLPEGKNLVGAFHQPQAVLMDLEVLETLPKREVSAGWAEIIKTAAIRDAKLFRLIERERDALLSGDSKLLTRVVDACVKIKAAVVEEDEKESGLRMILNFGHTLAHGIEAAQGYGGLLHGEAVSVGMVFAAEFGEELGITPEGTAERIARVCEAYGLPTSVPGLAARTVWSAMGRDKKRGPKGLRWVLLAELGEAMISGNVPDATAKKAATAFLKRVSAKK